MRPLSEMFSAKMATYGPSSSPAPRPYGSSSPVNTDILRYANRRSAGLSQKVAANKKIGGKYKNFWDEEFNSETDSPIGGSDFGSTHAYPFGEHSMVVDGTRIKNGDLGNFMVGVNAERSGIPAPVLNGGGLAFTALVHSPLNKVAPIAPGGTTFRPEGTGSVKNEFGDQRLYDAGRALAKKLGGGQITEQHIREYLLPQLVSGHPTSLIEKGLSAVGGVKTLAGFFKSRMKQLGIRK